MFLDVDNRSLFEVDVYALPSLSSTPRVRLGSVTSFSTVTLPVRRTDLRSDQTLVLFLHAIGSSSSWVSPGVVLDRGVRACLEIIGDMSGYLGRSSLSSMTTDDSVAAGKPLCMHGAMEGARAAGLGGKGGN